MSELSSWKSDSCRLLACAATGRRSRTVREISSERMPPGTASREARCGSRQRAYAQRNFLGGEGRLDLLDEAALRHSADDLVDGLAALEQDQSRDRHHLVARGRVLVVVDVELDDAKVVVFVGDLLEARRDHAARAAPRRPEVDEHGLVVLQNLGLKVVVGYFGDRSGHSGLLRVALQNEV